MYKEKWVADESIQSKCKENTDDESQESQKFHYLADCFLHVLIVLTLAIDSEFPGSVNTALITDAFAASITSLS